MEKIIIEVEDREQLLSALNNAIVALNDIKTHFLLGGIELPSKWEKWCDENYRGNPFKCEEILKERLKFLHNIYHQIELNEKI